MENKKWYTSKTLWFALFAIGEKYVEFLTPLAQAVPVEKLYEYVPEAIQGNEFFLIIVAGFSALRFYTKSAIETPKIKFKIKSKVKE